jgi:hypothetical protein
MTTAPPAADLEADDVRDPGWVRVGQAIKDDRQRRGWSRPHLVQRATSNGQHLTDRTLTLIEQGRIECKGGASLHAARLAYAPLGWTENLRARIQIDGAKLPPLPDVRAPRRSVQPAASLTTSLMACRPEQVARLDHELTECVERVRSELIRLGMGLTLSGTTADQHHAAASRLARHLITTRVINTLAEVEDNDYTAPFQEPPS